MAVSFANSMSNRRFRNNGTSSFMLTVNRNHVVPNFRSNVGNRGTNRRFAVSIAFPRRCRTRGLGNGTTGFTVGLGGIRRHRLPRLATRFVGHFNIRSNSMRNLHTRIHGGVRHRLGDTVHGHIGSRTVRNLMGTGSVSMPTTLVSDRVSILHHRTTRHFNNGRGRTLRLPHRLFRRRTGHHMIINLLLNRIVHAGRLGTSRRHIGNLVRRVTSTCRSPGRIVRFCDGGGRLVSGVHGITLRRRTIRTMLTGTGIARGRAAFGRLVGRRTWFARRGTLGSRGNPSPPNNKLFFIVGFT